MSIKTENQIRLNDKYSVGYAEYGDPKGKPVLHFHGCPSSRFELHRSTIDEIAVRLQARVIVIDRPGIGLSDFRRYTIATWPEIVAQFADRLGLEKFAVMGLSGGGKYVAACAWKIPQRLTGAGMISSTCSFDLPGAKQTWSQQDKQMYSLADKAPWLLRFLFWSMARKARKNPDSILSLFGDVSEVDKEELAHADIQQLFKATINEAFRQGTGGVTLDWTLEARPWGFPIERIEMPVYLWHGEQDKLVSVDQSRILATKIPKAQVKFYPQQGHISLIGNHYEELLGTVIR